MLFTRWHRTEEEEEKEEENIIEMQLKNITN